MNKKVILKKYLPSNTEVNKFLRIWDLLDDYVTHEISLTSIFKTYPLNTELSEVLIKSTLLNTFYSAGVKTIDLIKVVSTIIDCNIDEDLQRGSWDAVYKLLAGFKKAKISNYYSFATKYCNWHNHVKYPIYDSFVDDVVWEFKKNGLINNIKHRNQLSDYKIFGDCLHEIYETYSLSSAETIFKDKPTINYKIIDKYLWLLGKLNFGKDSSDTVVDIKNAEKLLESDSYRAIYKHYIITRSINNSIKATINEVIATNTKATLRLISQEIGFNYDPNWNTQYFGKKLIEYINSKK